MAAKEPSPSPKAVPSGDIDRLTGALTRPAIEAATEAAIAAAAAGGEIIAVGYVGLDAFAALVEEYGGVVTDHLVRDVANRIAECLRPQDAVGRVERDEFMIVFRGLTSKFETLALSSKLRAKIAEPARAGKTEFRLAPRCGIAQYPANGKTVDELRVAAANAMRTLQVALRTAGVAAAQELVNKARAAVDAANAELAQAEAAYEEAVAQAAAASAAEAAATAAAAAAATSASPASPTSA
jgi:diguanylate cyclase (GGDEF)-like protein